MVGRSSTHHVAEYRRPKLDGFLKAALVRIVVCLSNYVCTCAVLRVPYDVLRVTYDVYTLFIYLLTFAISNVLLRVFFFSIKKYRRLETNNPPPKKGFAR